MVLVTHTGAKIGVERTTPLVCSPDADEVVIIASMGGAPTNPAWYHNLVANPEVTVELGTDTYGATGGARQPATSATVCSTQQAAIMPFFTDYQAKTTPHHPRVRARAHRGLTVRLLAPLTLGSVDRARIGSCSARTSPTSATTTGGSPRATPPTTSAARAAAAASSSPRAPACTTSDWPYERAPLAERCGDGWAAIAAACHAEGALVIASLDHAGGQGSSAYSQAPLWAPSRVPEVNTREVPKWMEADDIAAVVAGFGGAAKVAVDAGCDGVEINAGQHSLVRQFLSGLTNHRGDEWGSDRLLFARQVIERVRERGRRSAGRPAAVVRRAGPVGRASRPRWRPTSPPQLCGLGLDYLVVVRGSIFSADTTRPDHHEPTGFNIDVCRQVRSALRAAGLTMPVFLQGSVVDWGQAEWAIGDGVCDAVEMTRAQLADPDLVGKLPRRPRRAASGRASAATRRARCATLATRS